MTSMDKILIENRYFVVCILNFYELDPCLSCSRLLKITSKS